jgi:uncharacterized protein (TIGR00375 family)
MKLIADLHFHSKYSRAVSPQMVLSEIAKWANLKGIDLITTADFVHPLWLRELKANLEEAGEGIYRLKGTKKPYFIFTAEVSSIYTQGGRVRRIHNLIFAPDISEATKIEQQLASRGNVLSDGRPIFGLSAKEIADLVLNLSPKAMIIPAHIWTPHFSLYGSQSGFDSMEECYGNFTSSIYAVETGLSSDPQMNWRIEELDNCSLISCSDAHSGPKLGREATVFEIAGPQLNYKDIRRALMGDGGLSHTLEFYPEEGIYHYTGHRNCKVRYSPNETKKLGTTCPVCGKGLTVGVLDRVEKLADKEIENDEIAVKNDEFGVKWFGYKKRPPYAMLVPLLEIIAESIRSTVSSQKTINEYKKITEYLGGELNVLTNVKIKDLEKITNERIVQGIIKVRSGDIVVDPGYDGLYGIVKIWPEDQSLKKNTDKKEQLFMF